MSEKLGIQNIVEIMDALKVLGVSGVKIAKGGIGLDDIPKVIELAKQYEVIEAAIKDAEIAVDEAKDLDQGEAAMLVGKVFELVSAIKTAQSE